MLNEIIEESFLKESKYKQFDDNLILIYDFISIEEQQELLNIINSLKNDEWVFNDDHYSEYGIIIDYEITKILTDRFLNILKNKTLFPTAFSTLLKIKKNDKLDEHIDYGPHIDNMIYSSVLYINDNFDGGELYFTNKNIEIKPVERALAVFCSDEYHLVKPVTSEQPRYCLPNFCFKDYNKMIDVATSGY